MSKIPEFSNWQDAWEWHAGQTANTLNANSVNHLLRQIKARKYDPYYQIWYALRAKATLAECAPTLLDVLRRETGKENMLIRYHCAAALFHLLGHADDPIPPLRARVQWDKQGEAERQAAIDELEALIQAQLDQI